MSCDRTIFERVVTTTALALVVGCTSAPVADAGLLVLHDTGDSCPHADAPIERASTATRSPDGMGWCCLPDTPTCNCGFLGGFVVNVCDCAMFMPPAPPTICDLAPGDWIPAIDAHGCAAYTASPRPVTCCFCP